MEGHNAKVHDLLDVLRMGLRLIKPPDPPLGMLQDPEPRIGHRADDSLEQETLNMRAQWPRSSLH